MQTSHPISEPELPCSLASLQTSASTSAQLFSNDTNEPQTISSTDIDSIKHPPVCPGSPSSGTTVRRMDASGLSRVSRDDLYLQVKRSSRTLRRRSSHLSRWLQEQQNHASPRSSQADILEFDISDDVQGVGTECNPYLAYPHLSGAALRNSFDDAGSMHSYVILDESHDYPPVESGESQTSVDHSVPKDTSTPRSTLRITHTPPSIRNFQLSLRSASPSAASSASRSPSRLSMFQRSPHPNSNSGASNGCQHSRSTSLQTLHPHSVTSSDGPSGSPGSSSSPWRWRPSVLGHFSSSSVTDTQFLSPDSQSNPSRPSISSSNTQSSFTTPTTTTYDETDMPHLSSTPQKTIFLNSLRSRARSPKPSSRSLFKADTASASTPALWSLPLSAPHLADPQSSPSSLAHKASTIRLPFVTKAKSNHTAVVIEEYNPSQPHVVYKDPGKSRVSLSSISSHTRSKKKKLVISGIGINDSRRLEAATRWCQSFGEVDQITRMPNGDLHVNFRKAEVADTVCRVRAKVHIASVGSVYLSWFSGNKRP